jgi:transcriptional regulator with XRE-family HTH domain
MKFIDVGRSVRILQADKMMSIDELATLTGLDPTTIKRLRRSPSKGTIVTIQTIANRGFGMSLSEFLKVGET